MIEQPYDMSETDVRLILRALSSERDHGIFGPGQADLVRRLVLGFPHLKVDFATLCQAHERPRPAPDTLLEVRAVEPRGSDVLLVLYPPEPPVEYNYLDLVVEVGNKRPPYATVVNQFVTPSLLLLTLRGCGVDDVEGDFVAVKSLRVCS